jgi:hypothetical protein
MPESESVGSTIGVKRGVWGDLPPDMAIMLAPPVTVTARPAERAVNSHHTTQLGRSRRNMPVGGHRTFAG